MGDRYFFSPSQMSGTESNHIQPQPHLRARLENTAVSGANSIAYFSIAQTSNDLPPSSFNSVIPNYRSTTSGMSYEPYVYSSGSSSSQISTNYAHGPHYHNQLNVGDMSGTIANQLDISRASFKRKSPAAVAFDRGETSRNFAVGSSSNPPTSSDYMQPKPASGPQGWPCDLSVTIPGYMNSNLLTAGEGTHRNVRRRHTPAFNLDVNIDGDQVMRDSTQHFHTPAFNLDVNIDGDQVMRDNTQHFHPTGNIFGISVAGQFNHSTPSLSSHQRTLSSGPGYYNNRSNQSFAGSSMMTHAVDIDGGYHPHRFSGRNGSLLPTLHGPSRQGSGLGCNSSYGPRTMNYGVLTTYPSMDNGTTLEDGRHRVETVTPSRPSRPQSILRRRNVRNERTRTSNTRFHSFSGEDNSHRRWASEGPIFYDSTYMFDHHQGMRLDIDNMSYEELLALEERIGSVCTGVSEDKVSRCLTETNYRSSDQIQDDEEKGNCAICLEEYKDTDNLGKLNCRHDFHYGCIEKWLSMKNLCPICKSPALADSSKEK